MKDERSFRLMIGLLAAAWVVIGIAITAALVQTQALGEPIAIATLAGVVLGVIGLVGTWSFRKWGPVLYLAANLLLVVKPWLFGADADAGGIGWGYWLLLLLF